MSRGSSEIDLAPMKDGAGHPYPVKDLQLRMSETYSNNPMVRKAFVKHELTAEHTMEIIKCKRDPIYFMEKYLRIITLDNGIQPFRLFEFQKRMVKQYMGSRFCLTLTSRQMGKTTVMAGFLLWYAIFHKSKQIAVLANKGDQAQEIMDRIRLMFEYLPFFLQLGVEVYNKTSLVFENKSKIFSAATSSSSVRGRSCVTGDAKVTVRDKVTGEIKEVSVSELSEPDRPETFECFLDGAE